MANKQLCFLIASFYCTVVALRSWAITDGLEVQALQDMYRSLNRPTKLEHWKSEGGDPCGETWLGIECSGSSITHMNLHGLGLTGNLEVQLSNLISLKNLDLSANNIEGSIPYSLPPNLTNLNLAENKFSQSFPYSLDKMKILQHLNLSHNLLAGPLGDVFNGLQDLKLMDLSFNNFSGDLPTSFESLTNLTQLNIEDNHFSGVIPEHFQTIEHLWIGGNTFHTGPNYTPWSFPSDLMPTEKNISSQPDTNLSASENHPSQKTEDHKNMKIHVVGIVLLLIGGVTLVVAFGALAVTFHKKRVCKKISRSMVGSEEDSLRSLPIETVHGEMSMSTHSSPHVSGFSSSPMITPSRLHPVRTKTLKVSRRKSFAKTKTLVGVKAFTENLIGDGSLGPVYRAEFPDGKILAVKSIKTIPLSIIEEQQFFDVIKNASRMRHPNIVPLVGFCMERGQHLIVYEHIRNLSLDEALHCPAYTPLSWGLRLRIALGVAQALNYTHTSFVPPIAHSNIKAANILLDEEHMPHVCDYGLAILRPLACNSVKIKASEMAIADSGYIAPEHNQPGNGNIKADVYAFGVLLLELLTARKPFDYLKPTAEQSLVRWASSKLHDSLSLVEMVDPAMARTVSSRSLSHFADIVSLCIQPEQQFRAAMSEIVESLMNLLRRSVVADGSEADPLSRSFRSSNTHFVGSPASSTYCV
ncbi:Protein STRUBBELIG-RECEPTOR FAMILY 2 [Striga hermonthica]|uniref:Protein STRUBBELIG-RECEPTOR FAMILY 2 n=1 Tax=Striga hermonthica TaxID=68872 RepID=A0A9N7R428_STRHE|nr:Protein STRUBBELIG-RECEPTOR FAMILY 2 [Striga hermonthica]